MSISSRIEALRQLVRLGGRSFDLLLQLVKRTGECLGKDELLASVWAGVVVEEASVRVHMSLLRKALGEPRPEEGCKEWISNIPLRGYRFNARARHEAVDKSTPAAPAADARVARSTKPPARLTRLVGRDSEVDLVLSLLEEHRLVTIAGSGGIGKTSVAIRTAECLDRAQGAQVAFVDLAPLISQDHVIGTLARAVGVAADVPDTLHAITQCLLGQDVLLLVDNCEHMLDMLPQPIASLLAALPRLRVLATSREVLRVTGEFVMRLPALAFPDALELTLEEAMNWPAVKLLVARARDAGAGTFKESHGALLARISQQVDGVPLAIELVAARLGVQSVNDVALLLNDHMRLYAIGQRSAQTRHRTLAAALDWSVALLDKDELRMFRRLSVFRGRFDVDSALGVSADMDGELAFNALISLANKSLVFFDSTDSVAPYRMLDTTRSYAASLLERASERESALRHHMQLMLQLMRTAATELPTLAEQAWLGRYAYRLNDVRFALQACLTELADASAAAALITASASLWYQMSEVEEYRDGIIAALAMIEQQSTPDLATVARLHTGLLSALLHTGGTDEEFDAASDKTLAGALAVGVPALELQARWGHCTVHIFRGNYLAALQHSQTLQEVVQSWSNPAAEMLAHRVSAMTNHFCARFDVSRQHSEAAVSVSRAAGRTHANIGSDSIVAVKALFCRTLWIQGESASALRMATEAVTRAEEVGDAISLCAALRDPRKFPDRNKAVKRDPRTNLRSPTYNWDFWTLLPEALHQVTIVMRDRGIPASYRHMHGFGSHTYSFINARNERHWVKLHFKTQQGIRNLTDDEATLRVGQDRESHQRDLYEAIARSDFPKWTMYMQVMPEFEADQYHLHRFDLTKVWYKSDYPLIEIGEFELNRNPENFFQDVEQSAFAPSDLVPGIGTSPDKMLQARLFNYADAQRYRLGVNYHQIPVNAARCPVHSNHRDGQSRMDGNYGGTLHYEPNSFGQWQQQSEFREPPLRISGNADFWSFDADDSNYFEQPGKLFRLMTSVEQDVLFGNTARSLGDAQEFIKSRHIRNCHAADPAYGAGVATALGLDLQKMLLSKKDDPALGSAAVLPV